MVVFTVITVASILTGMENAVERDIAAGVPGSAATLDELGESLVSGPISAGAISLAIGLRGIGSLVLGASNNSKEDGTTFDCWKQVIHDESKEPSRGMLLKDIYSHPNVMKVTTTEGNHPDLPRIVIENIWNEVFEIEYLWVHATGNIFCHALPI